MKDITIYTPAKYNTDKYTKVKDNIYKTYDNFMKQDSFVTSLSFEQEPEYGEVKAQPIYRSIRLRIFWTDIMWLLRIFTVKSMTEAAMYVCMNFQAAALRTSRSCWG